MFPTKASSRLSEAVISSLHAAGGFWQIPLLQWASSECKLLNEAAWFIFITAFTVTGKGLHWEEWTTKSSRQTQISQLTLLHSLQGDLRCNISSVLLKAPAEIWSVSLIWSGVQGRGLTQNNTLLLPFSHNHSNNPKPSWGKTRSGGNERKRQKGLN